MNKKIFLILFGVLLLPILVSAQDVTVQSLVDAAVQTGLAIASGVVVLLWVLTGILFLSASGDPGKLDKAKLALFAAVGGTVIVIIAQGALPMIENAFNLPSS